MDLLEIKVDNFSKKEILEKIELFLNEPKFHQITTINPEFILEAGKNKKFKEILNKTDLNIADGVGIWFSFLRFGKILKARLPGADLMLEILKIANERKLSIFLACKKDGLSSFEETRAAILKMYPRLEIFGEDIICHPRARLLTRQECGDSVLNFSVTTLDSRLRGNDAVLLCNFGAPNQEIFINLQKHANIRLGMGVGGSFDFLTGKIRRAPYFMRLIGLEWFWRLILQPKRWKRIFNAVIIFPIKIILNR